MATIGYYLGGCLATVTIAQAQSAETIPALARGHAASPPPIEARLQRLPLATPLILNGGFGDYRGGHFHAGLDLGTRRRVGLAVLAPANGWIERVRSSGVGYGRALYLRAADGRTLEFGHLDAFAGPVAAFVENVKDSTGEYEQDLWPSRGRFPVRAGEVVAWTGESGAGGPHLHFEVRRGDVAYHPLRAGLALADGVPPSLVDLTLEALDDLSQVEGGYGPRTLSLARTDTVRAIGRLRAIVRAHDQVARGGRRVAPWSVGVEWNGRRTECRFDSVSWATDMSEAEYVYDAGRVTGTRGFVLWSAAGVRPRVLLADAAAGEEAGTIEIRPGDPPRALVVSARDPAGREVERRVILRPGAPAPRSNPGWWSGEEPWDDASVEFASLPGGIVRVGFPARAAKSDLEIQVGGIARRATRAGGVWSATFAVPPGSEAASISLPIAARADRSAATATSRGGVVWARRAAAADTSELTDGAKTLSVRLAAASLFEDATLLTYSLPARERPDLVPVGRAWQVEPSALPLRRPARIAIVAPANAPRERIGLYRLDSGRWRWVGARQDSVTRAVAGDSRRLGRFALFLDEVGPSAALRPPPAKKANPGPYSRWAVEASVTDDGSGVDAGRSYLEIDGRKAPTEWDPEAGRLRWRPAKPPGPGTHTVVIVAADRAGNVTRATGTFRMGP